MKISVIHPARNEHGEIVATVESMFAAGASEVIVYDDGSDTPIAPVPGTIHVRHEISRGPSVCRNLGARSATGDVLVFADAHTRIDDFTDVARLALERPVIVVPAMQSLYGSGEVTGYGRGFVLKGASSQLLGFDRESRRPETRRSIAGGNWGGFFVMSRTIYERIGGWVDHSYWGYNDPSLILKAWFAGYSTVLDRDVIYRHKGKVKRGFGYPVRSLHPYLNLLHTYEVLFHPDTVRERWLPGLQRHHAWMMRRGLEHIARPCVQAEKEDFQRRKVRSDAEFFHRFLPMKGFNGTPLPWA